MSRERLPSEESLGVRVIKELKLKQEYVVSLLALAIAWEAASKVLPPYIVPGWELILPSFLSIELGHVWITVARVLASLAASFLIGLALAIVMSISSTVERYLTPIVNLILAIPAISWVLFSILWFSDMEFRIFFVLTMVCTPAFLIYILDGIKSIPGELRVMFLSFRPTRSQYLTKFVVPALLPVVLSSWKVNLGLAIRVVTVAELVGTVSGIGYMLNYALAQFSLLGIFVWTLVLVVILFLIQAAIYGLESLLLRWRTW